MFGGFAPPQLTEEELHELEAEATSTIKQALVTAVILYFSPFAIDAVSGFF